MERRQRWLGLMLAAWLLGLVAGCGVASGEATPTAGGASGLTGLVLSASDVAGQPDTPLAEQLVIAVAEAQADAVLGLGGRAPTAERLRFLSAALAAPSPAIATALSDRQGQYRLALPAGRYILCLADSEQQPPALPATTRGCGFAEVPAGGVGRADLSSGFGEVLVIQRSF